MIAEIDESNFLQVGNGVGNLHPAGGTTLAYDDAAARHDRLERLINDGFRDLNQKIERLVTDGFRDSNQKTERQADRVIKNVKHEAKRIKKRVKREFDDIWVKLDKVHKGVQDVQEANLHAAKSMQAKLLVPAHNDRLASLRTIYKSLFVGKQVGEWVRIPARLQPGDNVIVVEAKAGLAKYVGRVGIWRGANRRVDGWVGLPPLEGGQRFKQSCLRLVVRKLSDE
jgi:hypothetical protein